VLASFLFAAAAPDAWWTLAVLLVGQSATLIAALWTSGLDKDLRVGSTVTAISAAAALALLLNGGQKSAGTAWLLNVVLVLGVTAAIVLGVIDQGEVNRQSVTGAICVYLEIGMLFTFIYGAAAAFGSAPFFAQGTDGSPSLRLYFSYVTLATLGYGDYTPAGNPGHTLAIVEALLGQLYLVTIVALLVGKLRR
jgi:4-amino-4-deoxy-L-arabinose transferase-like glycosyltransferase